MTAGDERTGPRPGSRPVDHNTSGHPTDDTLTGLRRRREAALRLPPLACGCRDPETLEHREGWCRWQPARARAGSGRVASEPRPDPVAWWYPYGIPAFSAAATWRGIQQRQRRDAWDRQHRLPDAA